MFRWLRQMLWLDVDSHKDRYKIFFVSMSPLFGRWNLLGGQMSNGDIFELILVIPVVLSAFYGEAAASVFDDPTLLPDDPTGNRLTQTLPKPRRWDQHSKKYV